jgi:hypothetical protein
MDITHTKTRSLFVMFTIVCTAFIFLTPRASGMENDIKPYQPSAFMVIQSKTVHEIVASKQRFAVTRETENLDINNNPLKLQMLPVPCKAQIDYDEREYGRLVALRIKVKEVFADATTNWTIPSPE